MASRDGGGKMIPTDEHERRRLSVQATFDDLRVDGLHPSPNALADADDYISGRRTLDELIERVVQRHTRS